MNETNSAGQSRLTGKSPRHGVPFDAVPTDSSRRKASYAIQDYAAILDCVYEMSDMLAASNGMAIASAVTQVLRDEEWHILPEHKAKIIKMLENA